MILIVNTIINSKKLYGKERRLRTNAHYLRCLCGFSCQSASKIIKNENKKRKKVIVNMHECPWKVTLSRNQSSVREIKRKSISKLSREFCGNRIKFPLFYFILLLSFSISSTGSSYAEYFLMAKLDWLIS